MKTPEQYVAATGNTREQLADFFRKVAEERMAVAIAYGVFLNARDLVLSGITQGKWLDFDRIDEIYGIMQPAFAPNLRGVVWRRPGAEPMQGLEFFEFYDLNREVFLEKARALLTIMQSLGAG